MIKKSFLSNRESREALKKSIALGLQNRKVQIAREKGEEFIDTNSNAEWVCEKSHPIPHPKESDLLLLPMYSCTNLEEKGDYYYQIDQSTRICFWAKTLKGLDKIGCAKQAATLKNLVFDDLWEIDEKIARDSITNFVFDII